MCGRYDLNESPQMLMLYVSLTQEPEAFSNDDVRPSDLAPIIRAHDGQRTASLARWGLLPRWKQEGQPMFNARGETVAEKPSYRSAFKRRRCLVPVSAFFEWRPISGQKKKQKLRFAAADGKPLALAGLWEPNHHLATGEGAESYTVITIAPNAFMAPFHDRMPVILSSDDWATWLDPDGDNPLLLQSMIQPCPNDMLDVSPM